MFVLLPIFTLQWHSQHEFGPCEVAPNMSVSIKSYKVAFIAPLHRSVKNFTYHRPWRKICCLSCGLILLEQP